jgi:TRAP-type C4-dicarboxylate transport system permease large subunit
VIGGILLVMALAVAVIAVRWTHQHPPRPESIRQRELGSALGAAAGLVLVFLVIKFRRMDRFMQWSSTAFGVLGILLILLYLLGLAAGVK